MQEDIRTIETKVTEFRRLLIECKKVSDDQGYKSFFVQVAKYWDKLFTDPIEIEIVTQNITIKIQKNNNMLEQFFWDLKRDHIRKTGSNSINKTI